MTSWVNKRETAIRKSAGAAQRVAPLVYLYSGWVQPSFRVKPRNSEESVMSELE